MAPSNSLDSALQAENRSPEQTRGSAVGSLVASFIALIMLWRRRSEGRRAIRSMTSEQLRELDLDVPALRREAEKPFWRA